ITTRVRRRADFRVPGVRIARGDGGTGAGIGAGALARGGADDVTVTGSGSVCGGSGRARSVAWVGSSIVGSPLGSGRGIRVRPYAPQVVVAARCHRTNRS